MPVYLCQSGSGQVEPWRYGIQVYASPFTIDEVGSGGRGPQHSGPKGGGRDLVVASETLRSSDADGRALREVVSPVPPPSPIVAGSPIRRIRHAEIVLVDDVSIAYGRYWLRLRWPGHTGGFAGYIAMAKVSDVNKCRWILFVMTHVLRSWSYLSRPPSPHSHARGQPPKPRFRRRTRLSRRQ
jgi:hypothetical protein